MRSFDYNNLENLKLDSDIVFFEFDWKKIDVPAILNAREEVLDIIRELKPSAKTQEKEITRLPSVKSPDKIERLYLEMYYSENSSYRTTTHYYDAPSKTETHHRTETRDLNPKYVKDHLPKGLSLKKDKKGYYLVLDAQEISKRKLSDIGKKYNPDLTISVLQASC